MPGSGDKGNFWWLGGVVGTAEWLKSILIPSSLDLLLAAQFYGMILSQCLHSLFCVSAQHKTPGDVCPGSSAAVRWEGVLVAPLSETPHLCPRCSTQCSSLCSNPFILWCLWFWYMRFPSQHLVNQEGHSDVSTDFIQKP